MTPKDQDGTTGLFGQRLFRPTPGDTRLGLSEGLAVEWKSPDAAPVTACPVQRDGMDCLALDLPAGLGWVRLSCALDLEADGAAILGCRALLLVEEEAPGPGFRLRPMLARVHSQKGHARGIDPTGAMLDPAPGQWQDITAAFLCDAPAAGHEIRLLIDLPQNSRVTLALVETRGFAARPEPDSALAARLQAEEAVPLAAFSRVLRPAEDVAPHAAAPGVFAAEVALDDLSLSGWALTAHPATPHPRAQAEGPAVVLRAGARRIDVAADCPAEPMPGLRLDCGFGADVLPLLTEAEFEAGLPSEISCHLATAPAPDPTTGPAFAKVPVPAARAWRNAGPAQAAGSGRDAQEALVFPWPADPGHDPYRPLLARGMAHSQTREGGLDAAIARLEAAPAPQVTLHLHALAPLLADATSPAEAEALQAMLAARLRYFVHLGGTLLWTVHDLPDPDRPDPDRPDSDRPDPDRPDLDTPRPAPPFSGPLRALGKEVAALARVVHVHGQALVAPLLATWPIPAERVLVAAHPSHIGHYPDYVTRAEARTRLGLPQDAPVFLLFGRFSASKRIEPAIEAFAALRHTRPEAHLLIVGQSDRPDHKGMLRRRFGALPHVHVTETQVSDPALQWYHKAADWAIMPYRAPVTPGAAICAMSFARPVIAPRLGMLPELVQDGETGLLYDPEGSDGLEQALIAAAGTDPVEAAGMGARARETVARQSWPALGAALETALAGTWRLRRVGLRFEDRSRGAVLLGRPFPPRIPARVAVIVLNYGDGEDARRLIGALGAQTVQDFDIYLVDNASPELSPSDLAVRFNDVHVLSLSENLGYAGGNNAALRLIAELAYEHVWILNPDITVPPEALEQHLEAAEAHPDVAIFGPVLCRGADPRRVASAGSRLSFEGGLSTGNLYAGELLEVLPQTPYEADFVTGAALFLRHRLLDEIGLIPERYFLYFEETEWLVGAARKGWRSLVLPHVRLTHHKRSETPDLPETYFFYYYLRNSLLFEARMGPGDSAAVIGRLRADFIANWYRRIARGAPERLPVYEALAERALADGLAGRHGPVDLVAIELGARAPEDLAQPTPEEIASLTAGVDGSARLRGRVVLAAEGPCIVTACIGQRIVAVMQAEPAGKVAGGTAHVFSASLPGALRDDRGHRIGFRLNGQPVPGGGIDVFLPRPEPAPAGRIDRLERHVCTGWLRDRAAPGRVMVAELLEGDRIVGRGAAGLPFTASPASEDLPPETGETGGFAIRLPKRLADGQPHALRLRIAGTGPVLAEATLADLAFSRGEGALAPLKPPQAVLEDMVHRGPLALGAHLPEALPIGRHAAAVRADLVRKHTARPDTALVSIVMPVFNAAGTLREAVQSVLDQSHARWELLIVDDASTDGTAELAEEIIAGTGDARLRLIRLPRNGGVSAARNAALAEARGALIAYLDADDLWDPAYLAVMTGEMAGPEAQPGEAPQSAFCGHFIGQTGMVDEPDTTGGPAPQEAPAQGGTAETTEITGLSLLPFHLALAENRRLVRLSGFMHRRALVTRLGGFDPEMRRFGDRALILRYAADEIPHRVPAALVTTRRDATRPRLAETEPQGLAAGQLAAHVDRMAALAPGDPAPPLRPVDVVLMAGGLTDAHALRRRLEEIAPTLPAARGARLVVQAGPQVAAELARLSGLPVPGLTIRPLDPARGTAAALADALALRNRGADLALLEPQALVLPGWIEALNRAIGRVPEGGMFVTRHGIGGRHPEARRHAPGSLRQADTCITLSEQLRNLRDPLLDRRENLMEITGFLPFCVLVPAEVAALLPAPPDLALPDPAQPAAEMPQGPERAEIWTEWADFTRLHLRRKLVYCGRARAFDLPV